MVCKKCGAENMDNTTFCSNCGTRIDEKRKCEVCKQWNDKNSIYCVHCGTRMDGKKVCSNCGNVYEGKFCSVCGKGFSDSHVETVSKTTKYLDIVGSAFALFGVLISLIFVFFIGVKYQLGGITQKSQTSTDIFYYFGKYYKEIRDIGLSDSVTEWFKQQIGENLKIFGIFCTVISAVTLLFVILFAIITIIIYIRNWLGYTKRKADKWAVACVISFLMGGILFSLLHRFTINYLEESIKVQLNTATITGIILSLVCIGFCFVLKLATYGKEIAKPHILIKLILATTVVIFLGIALISIQKTAVGIQCVSDDSVIEIIGGFQWINALSGTMFMDIFEYATREYHSLTEMMTTWNAYNVFLQVIQVCIVVFLLLAIWGNVKKIISKEAKFGCFGEICGFGFSVLFLIFIILTNGRLEEIFTLIDTKADLIVIFTENSSFASAILAMIFSFLALIIEIILCAVESSKKHKYNIE